MRKSTYITIVLMVLLCTFALRMWHLNSEPIWHDEGWSIRAIQSPFGTPDDNTPYGYYVLSSLLWRTGIGDSPLAFRYSSVLLGVIGVAIGMMIANRWYGRMAGIALGALMASSPLLWDYAQEVRAYIAVPIIALILLYGAGEILKRDKNIPVPHNVWILVFVAQVIGIYTHNLTVPVIVWLNVALGITWLMRVDIRKMLTWAGIEIAVIVLYVPWLTTQSPSGTPLNSPPEVGFGLVRDVWHAYFLPIMLQLQQTDSTLLIDVFGVITLVAIVMLIGASVSWQKTPDKQRKQEKSFLLVSHVILVPVFSTALILAASIDFHPRYYVASVPATLLLIVAGVMALRVLVPRKVVTAGLVAIVGLGTAISAQSLHTITTTRAYQHDDFAGLAEYYATLPDDAVIIVPFNSEPALQVYYAEQYDIQAQFVTMPLYADEATVIETLNGLYENGTRQVEFLTWFQLPADVRGMYPCLLTAISDDIGEAQFYFGLSTQGYQLASPIVWQAIDLNVVYGEVVLQDADYISQSRNGVCVRTSWTLRNTQNPDVNLATAILNPLGDEIGRDDAIIATDDNVPTSDWENGDEGQAYTLITLPDGAPLTDYGVSINVYSDARPSGYNVLSAEGVPIGVNAIIESAIFTQGAQLEILPDASTIQIDSTTDGQIETGRAFNLTLILPESDTLEREIVLQGDGWALSDRVVRSSGLSWHEFIVPPNNSGEATLLVDDVPIATYTVIDVPRVFDAPDVDFNVDVPFDDAGTLYGVNVNTTLSRAVAPEVTLIWEATQTTDVPYTVFVQLLTIDGRVMAQSDAQPVQGTRPTTGWVTGEYITDTHSLRWNSVEYSGDTILIAGFYDADNGFQRVLTEDGLDSALLEIEIIVE